MQHQCSRGREAKEADGQEADVGEGLSALGLNNGRFYVMWFRTTSVGCGSTIAGKAIRIQESSKL